MHKSGNDGPIAIHLNSSFRKIRTWKNGFEILKGNFMNNDLTQQIEPESHFNYIPLIKQERPLFEENYVKNGGDLQFIKWDECSDGEGDYRPDWDKLSQIKHEDSFEETEFNQQILDHAEHVTSCLMSWVECARMKAIPEGWVLAPLEPIEKQKQAASLVMLSGGNAIESYTAMLHILKDSSN